MKAYVFDDSAMNLVIEAQRIRDSQDATSGWAPYTVNLLLHAKGEAYRALGDHVKAVQTLSLAATRIILERYKDYEYLENVLDGLVKALRARPRGKALSSEVDRLRRAWLQERAKARGGTAGRGEHKAGGDVGHSNVATQASLPSNSPTFAKPAALVTPTLRLERQGSPSIQLRHAADALSRPADAER
jgi:hypothetical protein